MLNHPVEREIATGFWLCESLCAGGKNVNLDAEFTFADELDMQDEGVSISTALMQCELLLRFLQLIWK